MKILCIQYRFYNVPRLSKQNQNWLQLKRKCLASRLWKRSDKISQSWWLPSLQNNRHATQATWPGALLGPRTPPEPKCTVPWSRLTAQRKKSLEIWQDDLPQRQSGFAFERKWWSPEIESLNLRVGVMSSVVACRHPVGPVKHEKTHTCAPTRGQIYPPGTGNTFMSSTITSASLQLVYWSHPPGQITPNPA